MPHNIIRRKKPLNFLRKQQSLHVALAYIKYVHGEKIWLSFFRTKLALCLYKSILPRCFPKKQYTIIIILKYVVVYLISSKVIVNWFFFGGLKN